MRKGFRTRMRRGPRTSTARKLIDHTLEIRNRGQRRNVRIAPTVIDDELATTRLHGPEVGIVCIHGVSGSLQSHRQIAVVVEAAEVPGWHR